MNILQRHNASRSLKAGMLRVFLMATAGVLLAAGTAGAAGPGLLDGNLQCVDLTGLDGALPLDVVATTQILWQTQDWEHSSYKNPSWPVGGHESLGYPAMVKNDRGQNPDGKYYLYYAHHDPMSGIGCAAADSIEGPYTKAAISHVAFGGWTDSQVLLTPNYRPAGPNPDDPSHYSSPSVVWNEDEQLWFMYFHYYNHYWGGAGGEAWNVSNPGMGHQMTALATTADLSSHNWTIWTDPVWGEVSVWDIVPVLPTTDEAWMESQSSYHAIQRLPDGQWLAFMRGTPLAGGPTVGFGTSTNGRNWNYFPENPTIAPGKPWTVDTSEYRPKFVGYLGENGFGEDEYLVAWAEHSNPHIIYSKTTDFISFERDSRGYANWGVGQDGIVSAWREGDKLYLFTGKYVHTMQLALTDPVYRWQRDPATPGDWDTASHWSRGVPDAEAECHVDNGGTALIASSGPTCADLYLGYEVGDEGCAELLPGGYLSTGMTNVGWGGTGTFRHEVGSHIVGTELVVAAQSGSHGTYEMAGGTLSAGSMAIGAAGQGQMTQSGGTITGAAAAAVLAVGDQPGGDGTYLLYGSGKVLVTTLYVGNGGTGLFTQAGPTSLVVAEEVSLGRLADSSGTYNMGGGILATNMLYIGWEGFGQLNQLGGTVGAGIVLVGAMEGSTGVCDISGGTFMAEHLSVGSISPGVLTISDPSAEIIVSAGLSLGSHAGLSAVPGATIHMTGSSFDNRSTQPSSLADLANLRLIYEGEGEMDSFEAAGRDLGATLAGFEENFALGTLQLGGEGGAGRVRLVDVFDNQPAWGGPEALYVIELIMGAGAAVDLNGSNLYYLNGDDPKQLFLGDANLNGLVNDIDLTALATHWQQAGGWAAGDFNGDGFVTDLDLTVLATAWPSGGLDISSVPEPATLSLLALGGLALLRRRRR